MPDSIPNSEEDDNEAIFFPMDSTSDRSLKLQQRVTEALDQGDTAALIQIVAPLSALDQFWLFEKAISTRQHQMIRVMLGYCSSFARAVDADGSPILGLAASVGHLEIVQEFVEAGADVNWAEFDFFDFDYANDRDCPRRYQLFTAMEMARETGHQDVVDYLAPLTDPWLRDRSGPDKSGLEADYFLFLAAGANRCDYTGLPAFDQCPEEYRRGAAAGRLALAQVALARGADTRAWFDHGWSTALHIAADEGDEELAQLLLGSGADTEVRDKDGATPLWRAVVRDQLSLARVLLAGGARPDAREAFTHFTPLMHAIRQGKVEMARLLLKFGADPWAIDVEGGPAMKGDDLERPANSSGATPASWRDDVKG